MSGTLQDCASTSSRIQECKKSFFEPRTVAFLAQQSKFQLCRQPTSAARTPGSDYSHNRNGFLTCVAHISGAIEEVIPQLLLAPIRHACHYPRLAIARHSAERSMGDSMQREVYWPHICNEVYTTVNNCGKCARNCTEKTPTRHLKLFPASCPLKVIARTFSIHC